MLPLAISSAKNDNWITAIKRTEADSQAHPFITAVSPDGKSSYAFGSSGYGRFNRFVYKFDNYGNVKWYKNLRMSSSTFKGGLCVDGNDNSYSIGTVSTSLSATVPVNYITKMNSDGTVQWAYQNHYQLTTAANPTSIKATIDNNHIYSSGHYSTFAYYIKSRTSDGVPIVQRRYSASTDVLNSCMTIDSSNNVYLSVTIASGTTLIKINSSDSIVWQRFISGIYIYDITLDSLGNPYLGGFTYSTTNSSFATSAVGHIFKYNSAGALQWQKKTSSTANLGSTANFTGFLGIRVSSDNKVYASLLVSDGLEYRSDYTGYFNSFPQLLCLSDNGTLLWSKAYGVISPANTELNSWNQKIDIDKNDTLYITYGQWQSDFYAEFAGMLKFSPTELINNSSLSLLADPVSTEFAFVLSQSSSSYQTISIQNGTQSETAGSMSQSDTTLNGSPLSPSSSILDTYTFEQLYNKRI